MRRAGISRRGFIVGAGATVAASAALAACGPGAQKAEAPVAVKFDQPVEVTFWHTQTGSNAKALQTMVDKFSSTNGKRITLKSEYQGNYTALFQKVMAAIQAGQPPDVAVAYESMIAEYMRANAVVGLDDYVSKGPSALSKQSLDDIFPAYLETNKFPQYNNKLLSFPFTKSLLITYNSLELLQAAGAKQEPRTWDEFEAAAKAVTRKGPDGKPTVYGWAVPVSASTFDGWVYSRGGELLTKDLKKVRFNEAPGIEALELVDRTFKGGYAYQPKGYEYQNDFGAKKVGLVQESSTGRPFFREAMQDAGNTSMKWSISILPQKDASKQPVTVMYGANIAVFKTTPLKQAAGWEWIKFFSEKEQTVAWAITSSYMPIRRAAAETPELKAAWEKDPQGKQAFDLLKYSKPEPNITAWQDIRTLLETAVVAVMTGKQTPKQALDEAARKANELIVEKS